MCIGGGGPQVTPPGAPPAEAATGASALKIGDNLANSRTSGIGRLFLRLTGKGQGGDQGTGG